jgi:hypothetical protein
LDCGSKGQVKGGIIDHFGLECPVYWLEHILLCCKLHCSPSKEQTQKEVFHSLALYYDEYGKFTRYHAKLLKLSKAIIKV